MPTFAVNMKHSAESCPLFNAEVKKRFKEMLGKREEALDRAKKHGVPVHFNIAKMLKTYLDKGLYVTSRQICGCGTTVTCVYTTASIYCILRNNIEALNVLARP